MNEALDLSKVFKNYIFTAEYDAYDTSIKIVGGKDAEISEMPFMANLGYNERSRVLYLCGGTLINR